MSLIEWSDSYCTGIPDIDTDHRHLFTLINDLYCTVETGDGKTSISTTIEALVDYVDYHFSREEALMEACGYHDIVTHRARHQLLQSTLESYKRSFEREPGAFDMEDFVGFAAHWLRGHILEEDMAYVPCIRQRVDSIADLSANGR